MHSHMHAYPFLRANTTELRRSVILLSSFQGLLTLDNGSTIEGTFNGSWMKRIEIVKGTLEDGNHRSSEGADSVDTAVSELQ